MKLNIFRTTIDDGNFTKEKNDYPNLSIQEINLLYQTKIDKFLQKTGFNINKYVILPAKNTKIKSINVTPKTKNVTASILILKENTQGIAVLVESTDDPVIIAKAANVCAVALGTIENLNNNIIHEIIETLIKETNAAPFEMTFYITSCPSKDNYILESKNELTNESIWKDSVIKKHKKYYLDIRYAIFNQLLYEIVDPNYIYFDSKDSTENKNYYSKFANRPGKNLTCVVYSNEEI